MPAGTRWRVSDTSIPPNTAEGDRSDCAWTDCVLDRKPDDISSVVIQRDDSEVWFNKLTIYGSEHSMVNSGNSDIGALSDFSDDDEETEVEHQTVPRTRSDRDYSIEEESNLCDRPVTKTMTAGDGPDSLDPNDKEYWPTVSRPTRQAFLLDDDSLSDSNYPDVVKNIVRRSRLTIMALEEYDAPPFEQETGCGTPGCECDECVEFKFQDSDEMTETDESEWEDTAVRDNWPYETNNIYNYSEGIIPRTYTPPLKEKRGRKYASPRKYEMDTEDYFSDTSDEEWPTPEQLVTPCMAADNVNRAVRNRNNNYGRCVWSGSENDITSHEICNHIDRSFTRLATAGAGIKDDNFSVNDVKCGKIPATKLILVGVLDTEKQLIMRVSMIT